MKLSSPPTRHAFTSVIAAAMKYGPTRISRIAYELDMPVETCRYYLKRFHNMGFRFFPVVDYWALGLQPCVLFIRFSKKLDPRKRENFLRWLDTVYTVYRASLGNEQEYYIETVPPQGEVEMLKKIMAVLQEAEVLNNFILSEVLDGYYKPEWIKSYDFIRSCWGEKIDIEIPKIPMGSCKNAAKLDTLDLIITSELEKEPTTRMKKIANRYGILPQLISYHREKHIEGGRLITGYVPARRIRHEDLKIYLIQHAIGESNIDCDGYTMQVKYTDTSNIVTVHIPYTVKLNSLNSILEISLETVRQFTIPREHYTSERWTSLHVFIEELEKILRTV
jgi:DNA-binding Lrp family transcriptional regulator